MLLLGAMVWFVATTRRVRADPAQVALAPVVALTVLLSPDILGVALATAGLWAWSRRRPATAGIAARRRRHGPDLPLDPRRRHHRPRRAVRAGATPSRGSGAALVRHRPRRARLLPRDRPVRADQAVCHVVACRCRARLAVVPLHARALPHRGHGGLGHRRPRLARRGRARRRPRPGRTPTAEPRGPRPRRGRGRPAHRQVLPRPVLALARPARRHRRHPVAGPPVVGRRRGRALRRGLALRRWAAGAGPGAARRLVRPLPRPAPRRRRLPRVAGLGGHRRARPDPPLGPSASAGLPSHPPPGEPLPWRPRLWPPGRPKTRTHASPSRSVRVSGCRGDRRPPDTGRGRDGGTERISVRGRPAGTLARLPGGLWTTSRGRGTLHTLLSRKDRDRHRPKEAG